MSSSKLHEHKAGIFLSGVESDRYWDIVVKKGGIRNVLTSYYYFRRQPKDTLKIRLEETPDVRVFIDSGAFTFKMKGEELSIEEWEKYLKSYVNWARRNKDYIIAVANLDIEDIVGVKQVLKWNKEYFEPLEADGVPVCYIWHPQHSKNEKSWEEYCKKYDYVGINSTVLSDYPENKLRKLINIAKANNTLIHGMAFTKTEVLVKTPMYSVDSTTWIVGQQYGELNWFDGRKMKRLKKKDWQRTYKTKLLKPPFNADWDLLMSGDTYELLRLNTVAYKIAQDHIQQRLGTKQYWLKGKSMRINLKKKSNNSQLPPKEWFSTGMNDYKDYAKKLNITVEADKDTIVHVIKDFFTFITKDEEFLKAFSEERLIKNALELAEEEVETGEEALEVLHQFYKANASGDLNDFSGEADDLESDDEEEDVDLEELRGKEREAYLEDEEFEVVALTEEDLNQFTSLPPPSGMDEVDEYDKELKMNNVAVVRNNKGQFVQGTKVVRKKKDIYSEKYPKLLCNTCYKSGDCPEYKAGYVCAYDKMFKRFDTRKVEDVTDAMSSIVDMNLGRLQKAFMFETMDGGMPTGEVSSLIDQNMRMLEKMKDLVTHTPKAIINQRTVINADGSRVTDTTMQANPTAQNGGILGALFSKYAHNVVDDADDFDADFKPPNEVQNVNYEIVVESSNTEQKTASKPKLKKKSKS